MKRLTALLEVFPLWEFGRGRSLGAGRPALPSSGQSGEQRRAAPQVAPVVPPLGPLPGLPGARLHLTPRLPSRIQLQQRPLLMPGHIYRVFGDFFPQLAISRR